MALQESDYDRLERVLARILSRAGLSVTVQVRTTSTTLGRLARETPPEFWKSSRPAASSNIAGVAAHAGGAEAAERRPHGRPSTARLHQEQ